MAKLGWAAFMVLGAVMLGGFAFSAAKDESENKVLLTQIRDVLYRDAHPRCYKSHYFDLKTCDYADKCEARETEYLGRQQAAADSRLLSEKKRAAESDLASGYLPRYSDEEFERWVKFCGFTLGEEKLKEIRQQRAAQKK